MPFDVKVAEFKGDPVGLLGLLQKYSEDFKLAVTAVMAEHYALFKKDGEELYIVNVSLRAYGSRKPYNVVLSVNGPNEKRTKELTDDLTGKIELDFKDAPDIVRRGFLEDDKDDYPDHYKN